MKMLIMISENGYGVKCVIATKTGLNSKWSDNEKLFFKIKFLQTIILCNFLQGCHVHLSSNLITSWIKLRGGIIVNVYISMERMMVI